MGLFIFSLVNTAIRENKFVNVCTYPGYSVFVHSITNMFKKRNVSGVARNF